MIFLFLLHAAPPQPHSIPQTILLNPPQQQIITPHKTSQPRSSQQPFPKIAITLPIPQLRTVPIQQTHSR